MDLFKDTLLRVRYRERMRSRCSSGGGVEMGPLDYEAYAQRDTTAAQNQNLHQKNLLFAESNSLSKSSLQSNYPIEREYQNTKIIIKIVPHGGRSSRVV